MLSGTTRNKWLFVTHLSVQSRCDSPSWESQSVTLRMEKMVSAFGSVVYPAFSDKPQHAFQWSKLSPVGPVASVILLFPSSLLSFPFSASSPFSRQTNARTQNHTRNSPSVYTYTGPRTHATGESHGQPSMRTAVLQSMRLPWVSLQAHIRDLQAALSSSSEKYGHATLACLSDNGAAQVMSFVAYNAASCALRAVSPQMRLLAETLTSQPGENDLFSGVQAQGQRMVHLLALQPSASSVVPPVCIRSLWWVQRCPLPVVLTVADVHGDVLCLLSDAVRRRVTELRVRLGTFTAGGCVNSSAAHGDDAAAPLSETCHGVLSALPTFVHLAVLRIEHATEVGGVREGADVVQRAFRLTAAVPLCEVTVARWAALRSFVTLAASPCLRQLTAVRCGVESLRGLSSCAQLTKLEFLSCRQLRDVSDLCDVPQLEHLIARGCALQSLEGVNRWPSLTLLDITNNKPLRDLGGLAGAPCLARLIAPHCNLQNIRDLGSCPSLVEVDISNNNVPDLLALAGAPCLKKVVAARCSLRSLEGLGRCPLLIEVDVHSNGTLRNLHGVVGAPQLTSMIADRCGLDSVGDLWSCPQLRHLNVGWNVHLQDLRGIAGAPALETLSARSCALHHLDQLGTCPMLREVDVSFNVPLRDLDGLAEAARLTKITATSCRLEQANSLGSCPQLQEVFLQYNDHLEDVSGLAACSHLTEVNVVHCRWIDTVPVRADVKVVR